MTCKLAVVIVASERRHDLVRDVVLPSVIGQRPYQTIVVGEYMAGPGYSYRYVPKVTGTTIDALFKRDVGTLTAKHADAILFICDDHALDPRFMQVFQGKYANQKWDILVPARYTERDSEIVWLNTGEGERYAGGHGAVYRRYAVEDCPFGAGPHHRLWDLLHSKWCHSMGYNFMWSERDLAITDVEPGAMPWL